MGAAARVERVRERAIELAPRAPGYEYVLVAFSRDRRHGGGLLAGALAFRLFGALLPLALLVAVLLGYAGTVERTATEKASDATGISQALLDSVAESSKLTNGTRWLVGASALVALLWAATWAARAIRAVHSIAWTGGVERYRRPVNAALVLLAALSAFFLVMSAAGALRAELGIGGTLLAGLEFVPFFGIWLGVAYLLPHQDSPLRALIPGAVLVAAGVELVHLATVLFIAEKVQRASDTYGSLGVAFTLLFWLYCVSRVVVAAAMLNAALWERQPRPHRRLTGTSAQP
jgi:membrane protein